MAKSGKARFGEHWDLPCQVWTSSQIDEFARVPSTQNERIATRHLLSRAVLWMQSYENWIPETHGIEYRCQCLENFPQVLAPDVAARSWETLSQEVSSSRSPTRAAPDISSPIEYSIGLSL